MAAFAKLRNSTAPQVRCDAAFVNLVSVGKMYQSHDKAKAALLEVKGKSLSRAFSTEDVQLLEKAWSVNNRYRVNPYILNPEPLNPSVEILHLKPSYPNANVDGGPWHHLGYP